MKKEYESPVYHVRRVPVEKVRANSYNPNHVAPPDMKLLELSFLLSSLSFILMAYTGI